MSDYCTAPIDGWQVNVVRVQQVCCNPLPCPDHPEPEPDDTIPEQWMQFATRSYRTAERVARHGLVEHPLTEAQYLVLRNCGVLRTDAEVKSFDTWEQAGSPEVRK